MNITMFVSIRPRKQVCIALWQAIPHLTPLRVDWTSKVATYTSLPPNFAIRHETTGHAYPSPTPSDARKPGVAKPLPGRLILGHPDCMQQTAAPGAAPPPSHAQPVAPLPQQPPPTHPDVPPAAQEQHIPPAASTASRACSPTPPPPPPEADPPSQVGPAPLHSVATNSAHASTVRLYAVPAPPEFSSWPSDSRSQSQPADCAAVAQVDEQTRSLRGRFALMPMLSLFRRLTLSAFDRGRRTRAPPGHRRRG